MTGGIQDVGHVSLPSHVVATTHAHLRRVGRQGLEGMALWAGVQEGDTFRITEEIIPLQQGIRTEHGLAVTVDGTELHRINVHLHSRRIRLIAQVHSHPTHAYHSSTDDRYAIATALGSFSLVVPDFAVDPFEIGRCAVYRLTPPGWWSLALAPRWARVSAAAAARLFSIGD